MIALDSTRTIDISLAAPITTNNIQVVVCYSDDAGNSFRRLAPQVTEVGGSGDSVICDAPDVDVVRAVDYISVLNSDTVEATPDLHYSTGGTLLVVTLQPGEHAEWTRSGWRTTKSDGSPKAGEATFPYTPEDAANKDTEDGYPGLAGWAIKAHNALGTIVSLLTNAATAIRTYTLPDKSITVAGTDDVDQARQEAKDYADGLVTGLWDDRGNFDASGNVFPSTGGSGTAGAILKGDIWTISVAGTLGGHAVTAGDTVRALVDSPGSTDGNWAIAENNIGYVPTNASVVPNTAPSAGQVLVGNAGGTAYAPVAVSGDVSLTSAGVAQVNALAADVAGTDHLLTRVMLKDVGATYLDKGNSGTSTQTLDYTAGSHQKVTCTGNFTLAVSNLPPTGNLGAILLEAVNFGANTVTWPTASFVKPDGSYTSSVSTWLAAWTGRTSFQSSGTDWIKIWSRDASTLIIAWAA